MIDKATDSRIFLLRFTGGMACLAALLLAAGLAWLFLFGERWDAKLADRRILTRDQRTEHRIYLEYRDRDLPRLLPLTVSAGEYGTYSFKGRYPVVFLPGRPWTARLASDHGVLPVTILFLAGVLLLGTAGMIRLYVEEPEKEA